jgi:hypothetical protein
MMSQAHSQTLSKKPRVKTIVDQYGDTLIQMNIKDAKVLLTAIKQKQVNDELLSVYMERDSNQTKLITVKDSTIKTLRVIVSNDSIMLSNADKLKDNQKKEIGGLKSTIKEKDKEIKKQKVLKNIGFIGCVVLPFLTLLYVSGGHL